MDKLKILETNHPWRRINLLNEKKVAFCANKNIFINSTRRESFVCEKTFNFKAYCIQKCSCGNDKQRRTFCPRLFVIESQSELFSK